MIKEILVDLIILLVIIIAAHLWAWLIHSTPHEVLIWGLIGWMVAGRKKS